MSSNSTVEIAQFIEEKSGFYSGDDIKIIALKILSSSKIHYNESNNTVYIYCRNSIDKTKIDQHIKLEFLEYLRNTKNSPNIRIDIGLMSELEQNNHKTNKGLFTDFEEKSSEIINKINTEDNRKKQNELAAQIKFTRKKANKRYTFEEYEYAKNNQKAYSNCKKLSNYIIEENTNPDFNFLCLYGKTGIGKSHLANAICNRLEGTNKTYCYYDIGSFEKDYVLNAHGKTVLQLKEFIVSHDLLIIDDLHQAKNDKVIDFFGQLVTEFSNHSDKFLLFITNNNLKQLRKTKLQNIEESVFSRLTASLEIHIGDLEKSIIRAYLYNKLNKFNMSKETKDQLADRIYGNDFRKLLGIIRQINFHFEDANENKEITFDEVYLCIQEQLTNNEITENKIIEITLSYFNNTVCLEDLQKASKKPNIVKIRHILIYLLHSILNTTVQDLSYLLHKDHSTISQTIKKIDKIMSTSVFDTKNKQIQDNISNLKNIIENN